MFADKYLQKNNRTVLIQNLPNNGCGIIVVIPCFREPQIIHTLESLYDCDLPESNFEVIVVINHSENASDEIRHFNKQTKAELENWISIHQKNRIDVFAIGPVEFPKKWAGAGLARKLGMDEAVRRFNLLENPNGIIVSLDADTLVERNYLIEIEKYFQANQKHVGATILFQHQTEGLEPKHLEGIQLYEKYMEYYKTALEFSGYLNPMFTVGSAFAVKADAYVKRGGMNRRQAGEDFYFLQNLAQIGAVGEITSTKVFPSARLSNRVPFGTGPILQKWMKGEEDLTQTYNFEAFIDLKKFFEVIEKLYKVDEKGFLELLNHLPNSVQGFIQHDNFWKELEDLNRNCSTVVSFQNRFFQKFNAFKILKYLNFVHEYFYEKANINEQIVQLLDARKFN